MISDRIRFAIIGYGHIGKQHAAFIAANADCALIGLCDSRPAAELGLEGSGIPFFPSEDDLLGQDFDVLCITTPNGLHERHALKALRGGRHVLIEKPMALTTAACSRILREAEKQNKRVFCVMQNRYSAPSVWLKGLLEKKTLGNVYMVTINCFWNRDERYYREGSWKGTEDLDGGTLFTQFSHFIDSLLWLFGDITDIRASFANFSHGARIAFEDSGIVQFNFAQGGMGCINYTTSAWKENLESSLTVIAEHGTVRICGQYMDEIGICHIRDYVLPDLPGAVYHVAEDTGRKTPAHHAHIFENIVAVLRKGQHPDIDPREACKVVETIENIYSRKTSV
jgi:UDP-N-acetyl-2-amino-2-deoxyglucuronate dehydrogenase